MKFRGPRSLLEFRKTRRFSRGFTLLELLVVVAILATLAGLVISRVDFSRRQADMAAAADTTAELSRNIQYYVMSKGVLPDGMDSLLGPDGNISRWIYDSSPSLVPNGSTGNTVVASLPKTVLGSLGRMGVLTVMDHDPSATYASDSGTIPRSIDRSTVASAPMLVIRPGSSLWNDIFPPAVYGTPSGTDTVSMHMPSAAVVAAVGNGSTDQVRNISFGINTDVYLVLLGIGKGNSMNGITITNPPIYPAPDPDSRYYRYVAVAACYGDGRRAQFKTVLDPFGRSNAADIQQYIQAKPN